MTSLSIQNKLGHVIDIQGNSTQDGALLDAYPAKNPGGAIPANQQWEFDLDPAGSGYYYITNPPTKLVIDVQGNSTKPGARLDAFHKKTKKGDDAANQLWQLILDPAGSGYCFIRNKLTGHVIDIKGNSTADGAALVAFPVKSSGNDNQLWKPLAGHFPPALKIDPVVTDIQGGTEFDITGSGFFPNDKLTLSYALSGITSTATESHSVDGVAASDGTFSCRIEPPNYPGPEFAPGTPLFGVTVKDQHGDYAAARCEVDASGNIANFRREQSGVGF